jgi:hypothetical protein
MSYNFKYYKSWRLVGLIVVLAAVSVPAMANLFGFLESSVPLITPSVVALLPASFLVSLVLWVINEYAWKFSLINNYNLLVEVPDFSGRYKGTSTSKESGPNGDNVESDVVIEIEQSASNIDVYMYHRPEGVDRGYISESLIAEILEYNGRYYIRTIYRRRRGEPGDSDIKLAGLIGCCRLDYIEPDKELDGEYFNEHSNVGYMDLEFESKDIKQKF